MDVLSTESTLFLLMLRVLHDLRAECRLVGKLAAMTVKIIAGPLRHRPGDPPAADKIMAPIPRWRHGIGIVANQRDNQAIGAAPKRNPRRTGDHIGTGDRRRKRAHATRPSTASAAASSTVT